MLVDCGIDWMFVFVVFLIVRFCGIKVWEGILFYGLEGWGEWLLFWDYDLVELVLWLCVGIEGVIWCLFVV